MGLKQYYIEHFSSGQSCLDEYIQIGIAKLAFINYAKCTTKVSGIFEMKFLFWLSKKCLIE